MSTLVRFDHADREPPHPVYVDPSRVAALEPGRDGCTNIWIYGLVPIPVRGTVEETKARLEAVVLDELRRASEWQPRTGASEVLIRLNERMEQEAREAAS